MKNEEFMAGSRGWGVTKGLRRKVRRFTSGKGGSFSVKKRVEGRLAVSVPTMAHPINTGHEVFTGNTLFSSFFLLRSSFSTKWK